MPELDAQHGRLDAVEPRVRSDAIVMVLGALPVVAQLQQHAVQGGIVGGDGAAVPEGAEILARIEAPRRRDADGADAAALPACAVRLAGILDEMNAMRVGDPPQRIQIGGAPVEMYGD